MTEYDLFLLEMLNAGLNLDEIQAMWQEHIADTEGWEASP